MLALPLACALTGVLISSLAHHAVGALTSLATHHSLLACLLTSALTVFLCDKVNARMNAMADHIDNACLQLSQTAPIMPVAPQSVQYTHQEIVANSEQGVTQVCHLPNHKMSQILVHHLTASPVNDILAALLGSIADTWFWFRAAKRRW